MSPTVIDESARSIALPLPAAPWQRLRQAALAERQFLLLLVLCAGVAALTYQTPAIAMWVGFLFAGYSAVANDSIQTLGTFLASNRHRPWWVLWLFIGGIFLVTMLYGWWHYNGDVSYARLTSKGLSEAPTRFSFLQLAAPLVLLVLTRLRMPVSTTFLLLSCFTASKAGLSAILTKSLVGYVIAFGVAIAVWFVTSRLIGQKQRGPAHPAWNLAQWGSTALLWSVWLMQDAANIAVYLPRRLGVWEFVAFAGFMVTALALLVYRRGGRIQAVVEEKSRVVDVRAATAIDAVYGLVLLVFTVISTVPMSTTWVFVGLLAGRELAIAADAHLRGQARVRQAWRLIGRDLGRVGVGLAVSYALALAINPVLS